MRARARAPSSCIIAATTNTSRALVLIIIETPSTRAAHKQNAPVFFLFLCTQIHTHTYTLAKNPPPRARSQKAKVFKEERDFLHRRRRTREEQRKNILTRNVVVVVGFSSKYLAYYGELNTKKGTFFRRFVNVITVFFGYI